MKKMTLITLFLFGATLLAVFYISGCNRVDNETGIVTQSTENQTPMFSASRTTIDFGRSYSRLDSVGMQIRISNVSPDYMTTAIVMTDKGVEKKLSKATNPFKGLTLEYNNMDIFTIATFSTLRFSNPLPEGAKVEIYNACQSSAATQPKIHASYSGFRCRMDVDDNQVVNTNDLAMLLAWIQTSRSSDPSLIQARTLEIFPGCSTTIATIPSTVADDLNNDGVVDTSDVAFAMAWVQVGRLSSPSLVLQRALEIYPLATGSVVYLPGEALPDLTGVLKVPLSATLDLLLVKIPSGTFAMGSSDIGGNAIPVHNVTISRPFYMGMYEVTQAQFMQAFSTDPTWWPQYYPTYPNRPVDAATFNDAVNFCNWLSDQTGLNRCFTYDASGSAICDFTKNGYRLPTEAEWEYACRAGTFSLYFWGETLDLAFAWVNGSSPAHTCDVGTRKPNNFGLYDMAGNVCNWCWDWYDPNYYSVSPSTDPTGPATGTYRVVRGSSWISGQDTNDGGTILGYMIYSGYRGYDSILSAGYRYWWCWAAGTTYGFRVVRNAN
ncbi:MAG: SUMF1/EgtB/PvdO family nonheme iron enzyme [Candidatus Riflebacteria bacterium]|nr:SUMF1/EgtB/PvdO family nonheme iron enzyme [Candidatus Riflebacteria bacterium]